MVFQVVGIMHLTVFDISPLVERIFSFNEVDTFSTSVSHISLEEGFYLKIALVVHVLKACTGKMRKHYY